MRLEIIGVITGLFAMIGVVSTHNVIVEACRRQNKNDSKE